MTFHLEETLRASAAAGQHNFINQVVDVLEKARFRVEFAPLVENGATSDGYSLTHMASPPGPRGLVFRRVYHYPFWQIDAVAQRWQWDVARADYEATLPAPDAERFFGYWQKRLFGTAAQDARRDGFVYVPLQGHLRRQRLFQVCTPLEMLGHLLDHTDQPVVATLHPKEDYSIADRAALRNLEERHPRLTIEAGQMERWLTACDYVVTQNSAVAFSGYFFRKPAILFAPIDFHHIALRADLSALPEVFDRITRYRPDYAHYIWWFWQRQSINAGREDARDRIAARLRRFDWPV